MILNLTQHQASTEQVEAGVVDLTGADLDELKALLTFTELPREGEPEARARAIADIARRASGEVGEGEEVFAMIGGAPYLMAPLEAALAYAGIQPVYAFSVRESVETTDADGSVRKTAIFRHRGFYAPELPAGSLARARRMAAGR
jgi:predicted PhzF superfamily epimerase YddE/YHI9